MSFGRLTHEPDRQSHDKYFYTLLTKPHWIERRVQTIEMIDGESWKQRVSIDIDVEALETVADACGLGIDDDLPVPISVLPKGLLLDFSLTTDDGRPMAAYASERSAQAWRSVLLQSLRESGALSAYSSFAIEYLADDLIRIVAPINALEHLSLPREILAEESAHALRRAIRRRLRIDGNGVIATARWTLWEKALEVQEFTSLLKCAIVNFIAISEVSISNCSRRHILKYSIQESQTFPKSFRDLSATYTAQRQESFAEAETALGFPTARARAVRWVAWHTSNDVWFIRALTWKTITWLMSMLGFAAHAVRLDTSLIGQASREHVRLICPPGVCIAGQLRYSTRERAPSAARTTDRSTIRSRATRGRAMLYTKVGRPTFDLSYRPSVLALLRPRLTGFLTPAIVALLISTILSFLSWQNAEWITKNRGSILDSLTTLLLLSASLSSLYVARADEHKYRCTMLKVPRTAIAISGVSVGMIAIVEIFLGAESPVSSVAFWSLIVCLTIVGYLILFWLCARIGKSEMEKSANYTVELPALTDNSALPRILAWGMLVVSITLFAALASGILG